MNAYASYLGNQDALEVIAATPARLNSLVAAMGPQGAEKAPAPGKWNARQIVCHLADCELVFAFRIRQTLAQERHVVQPFEQDEWARNYAAYSASDALALFSAARMWNCALVNSLDPAAFGKSLTHPERGDMTFRTLIETMAGHDLNHLRQLESLAALAA
jgi:hypothetical protein